MALTRLPAAAVMICWAGLLVSGVLAAQPTPRAESDSMAAHNAAVQALRQFSYQHWSQVGQSDWEISAGATLAAASCEIRVADFCYGPLNGRLKFGGIGTFRARRILDMSHLPERWQRRGHQLVERYAAELRKQREVIPYDRWLNGELVRLHVESGFLGRAQDELSHCRDVRWWCDALGAYVRHLSGDWGASDSLWSGVLGVMTPEERCEWLDPYTIVEDRGLRSRMSEGECAERMVRYERFWWLADPLFSRPWNERRAEHLSRRVALILDDATQRRLYATPAMVRERMVKPLADPMIVSPDTRLMVRCGFMGTGEQTGIISFMFGYPDLVMRAGVPSFCARTEQLGGEPVAYATQHDPPQLSFVPAAPAVTAHLSALAADWNLTPQRPWEYMGGWTRPLVALPHQAAWFRRGTSARLVVATLAPLPPTIANAPMIGQRPWVRGKMVLQSDYTAAMSTLASGGADRVVFSREVDAEPTLVSLEMEIGLGAMGRARFGSGPQPSGPGRVALSDILLVEPVQPLPTSLEEAEQHALGTTRFLPGSVIGVYWEVYGLRAGEKARLALRMVEQRGREPVRLLGERSVQDREAQVITTEWEDPPSTGAPVEVRTVGLDLGALRRGVYTLSITITPEGGEPVESVRTIEVAAR